MGIIDLTEETISLTEQFVKQKLKGAEGGHDWWHIHRVLQNARLIMKTEPANVLVVELAVLLHDISDSKFNGGDEEAGPRMAVNFLKSIKVPPGVIEHVKNIIRYMSFRSSLDELGFRSKEFNIVQDADRLDAIGAIGIARAFNYGGFKNREMYNPYKEPEAEMTKEQYVKSTAPTINHFYEKLLLLKDMMNTPTARKLAEERHKFMEGYLEQFYAEWNGKL
ncbi:MAG: HD domain-containing protein [Flavitalea sp.]